MYIHIISKLLLIVNHIVLIFWFSYVRIIKKEMGTPMTGEQRRNTILSLLSETTAPVSASTLASKFSVTRQIIVADIALLRALGHPIIAVHKGYLLNSPQSDCLTKRVVVKHSKNMVAKELYAIVDNGGKVLDVIVEHSVYNRISADLNLSSRYDVDEFVHKLESANAQPLSALTEGLHIHTIAVQDECTFERIVKVLSDLKILVEY